MDSEQVKTVSVIRKYLDFDTEFSLLLLETKTPNNTVACVNAVKIFLKKKSLSF